MTDSDDILEKDFNFEIFPALDKMLEEIKTIGTDSVATDYYVAEFNDLSRFIERKLK